MKKTQRATKSIKLNEKESSEQKELRNNLFWMEKHSSLFVLQNAPAEGKKYTLYRLTDVKVHSQAVTDPD